MKRRKWGSIIKIIWCVLQERGLTMKGGLANEDAAACNCIGTGNEDLDRCDTKGFEIETRG